MALVIGILRNVREPSIGAEIRKSEHELQQSKNGDYMHFQFHVMVICRYCKHGNLFFKAQNINHTYKRTSLLLKPQRQDTSSRTHLRTVQGLQATFLKAISSV